MSTGEGRMQDVSTFSFDLSCKYKITLGSFHSAKPATVLASSGSQSSTSGSFASRDSSSRHAFSLGVAIIMPGAICSRLCQEEILMVSQLGGSTPQIRHATTALSTAANRTGLSRPS
ncbi:Hypothetical predicted protein [Olea europaea subsp. europaea]|uniref:Uncharacterized protein n=1 Tax=Olea europaea subsp. europaea TaxID=158383 RepID=A0A8S0VIW7_OLEEU|nr:Hypothetical predicted protein [Olea europaea subsp. europaea]